MSITTASLKPGNKPKDLIGQDGMRLSNCFYCKEPKRERELLKYQLNSKRGNGGDLLLVCPKCYKQVTAK